METPEVVVETLGPEDGSSLADSRPNNAEVTVDILVIEEETQ